MAVKNPVITDFLSEAQATEMRRGMRRDVRDMKGGPERFIDQEVIGQALMQALQDADSPMRKGMSPFERAKERRGYFKQQGRGYDAEVPEGDAVVELQNANPQITPGGEVGVGQQGFGARALGGGEASVVNNMAPPGSEQTETPTSQAQSDVLADPSLPLPTPSAPLVPDVNYVLPTAGQDQMIAFTPNDPNAMFTARGPLSRNLVSQRTGYGQRYV